MSIKPDPVDQRLARLAFPLNIFACASRLEEGIVAHLHYGLFKSPDESIGIAQQRSSQLMLQRLPRPIGGRAIEIGVGFGDMARAIAQRGFEVVGISPDPVQISIAREHAGSKVSLHVATFEDLSVDSHAFDVVLAQESSQYIDTALLFAKAREALRPGGSFLVADQVALRRVDGRDGALHLDADIKAQASRWGFDLVEYKDLTQQAMPTLDYALRAIAKHGERLQSLIPLDALTLAEFAAAVTANRRRYHEGVLGYAFYHFRS